MQTPPSHHAPANAARHLHSLVLLEASQHLQLYFGTGSTFSSMAQFQVRFNAKPNRFTQCYFCFVKKAGLPLISFSRCRGFVFFWLYAHPIRQRSVSTRRFFWLRLSRLYPLHLATLLVAERAIFFSPILWIGYFVMLIGNSLLTHRCFERPLQKWIRRSSL